MDTKKLSEISIIFMALALFVFLLDFFTDILRPLAIAVLLSFLFTPLVRLSKKSKYLNVAKIVFGVSLVLFILVAISIISFSSFPQADELKVSKLEDLTSISFSIFGSQISFGDYFDVSKVRDFVQNIFSSFFSGFTKFISEFFLVIVFLIFILPIESIWIKKELNKKVKSKYYNNLLLIEEDISQYFKTKTFISFGTALSSLIVMFFLDINFAILFAIIIFALNYIPTFGDFISFGIIILVTLLTSGISLNFFILILLLLTIQMIWGNFIEPKIAGDKLELSPIFIILSILFWGTIWGVGGMFFAVPLTLFVKNLLKVFSIKFN